MATNLRDALYEAQRGTRGGWAPTPSNVPPGMAIDNSRPVNSLKWTGGGMPPTAPDWSTARGATPEPVRAPGTSLVPSGPGLAERQPTRVPFGASNGVAPTAASATPNLPATINGQGPTFQGNGARTNFTMPPSQTGPSAYDAEVTQRAKDMAASRQAAGGMNAGANQGVSAGVQGASGQSGVAAGGSGSGSPGANQRAYSPARQLGAGKLGTVAKAAVRAGPLAGAVENFNDYKIDDPGVDSSASGTFNSLRQGDFAGAGRGLSKGMLETGMDLGSYAANTADILVPGQPFSQGYNKMLRNQFGDQLIDNSGNGPTAKPSVPAAPGAPTRPINRMGQGFDDPRRVDRDPSRQNLGASRDFTNELASVPKNLPGDLRQGVIHKTMDANGRPVYSGMNVGANAQMVDGMGRDIASRGQVMSMPKGTSPFGSPTLSVDGQQYSNRENAIMAANLRDGVDPMRGINSGPTMSVMSNSSGSGGGRRNKFDDGSGMVTPVTGRGLREQQKLAQDAANAERTNQTTLRGQDMNLQGHLLPKQMEMEMMKQRRALVQGVSEKFGGDPQKTGAALMQMGLAEEGGKFIDLAKNNQELGTKAQGNLRERLNSTFFTNDDKGNRVADKETASKAYDYLNRVTKGKFETLPPEVQDQHMHEAQTRFGMVQGANARRQVSLGERLGFSEPTPAYSDMPTDEQLRGASIERAGLGWDTVVGQPGRLDYRLKAGGHEMFLPKNMSQDQLRYLAERGVQLPK